MSTEQKQSPLSGLLKLIGGLVTAEIAQHGPEILEWTEEKITSLFHKHSAQIAEAAKDVEPCSQGFHRDEHGNCVPNVG